MTKTGAGSLSDLVRMALFAGLMKLPRVDRGGLSQINAPWRRLRLIGTRDNSCSTCEIDEPAGENPSQCGLLW